MDSSTLPSEVNKALRQLGILSKTEVAFAYDDLFIAEDVITKSRRLIEVPTHLAESARNKQILRG